MAYAVSHTVAITPAFYLPIIYTLTHATHTRTRTRTHTHWHNTQTYAHYTNKRVVYISICLSITDHCQSLSLSSYWYLAITACVYKLSKALGQLQLPLSLWQLACTVEKCLVAVSYSISPTPQKLLTRVQHMANVLLYINTSHVHTCVCPKRLYTRIYMHALKQALTHTLK